MPYKWIDPQIVLKCNGKTVYHTYNDDDYDHMRLYWYTTDPAGSDGGDNYAFDIRDFNYPKVQAHMSTQDKLHYLVDEKLIKFP